jgi:phage repressor protein C with HTH and peptisase S24 domain
MIMRATIDTSEYVSNLKQLVEAGHEVVITVAGWSMEPFLHNQRDRVLLRKLIRPLKNGDIVFYQRKTGQYVLHRIFKKKPEGYYLIGDNQLKLEGPIEENAIFAVVTEVERNGRWFSVETISWTTACGVWRMLYPVRKFAHAVKKAMRK